MEADGCVYEGIVRAVFFFSTLKAILYHCNIKFPPGMWLKYTECVETNICYHRSCVFTFAAFNCLKPDQIFF